MARLDFTTRGSDLAGIGGENLTELQLRETEVASFDRAAGKENLIGFLPSCLLTTRLLHAS